MDIQALLKFLSSLHKNNNKDWFDAHRKEYESLRADWILFVGKLINQTAQFDSEIADLEPKKCIFRINRDIRFSANKSPYKNNFGVNLSKGGKATDFSGYYLHLQPGLCFIAGGAYQPEPNRLAAIRQEIDYNFDEFKGIVGHKDFKKQFGTLTGDKLQRPPKGYDAENPAIEFIKHKGFLAYQAIPDKELNEKQLLTYCLNTFKAMKPLNDFINRAIIN